ncbi:cobalt-precorrin-4/precorrin-4 C(11)-methyltransferase [uncultured Gordonia sp.]|uniref:cobalt-precorrin-4/precorrin-4 C(11)-methyltransferase n=1 Tax=uncultured Gordonia sp. TaxID=198437 RepID=UPI00258B0982|nr:cobalt-precorrin-4/precorrin-4 C(11)-methyltransferase [uncultured Gordonia sp.]
MTLFLIGAGPGAADLITVRGARILGRCRTALVAGSLVPAEILAMCPDDATIIDTARMPLEQIISHIVDAHRAGHDVARLHSGDLSLYSAVAEQVARVRAEGIDVEWVPGVPAFAAAASALQNELTVPGIGQSLLVTRVSTLSTDMPPGEDLTDLAAAGVTLALHLAAHRAPQIVETLSPVYGSDCPTATVAFASRSDQVIIRSRLSDLATAVADAGITRTAVIFVGRVLDAADHPDRLESYLYSHARMTKLRNDSHGYRGQPDDR